MAGDDKGYWNWGDMPSSFSYGCEQCRIVIFNIKGLVGCAGLLAPNNDLDVLRLAECGLFDRLSLMKLCRVLTNEQAEA